MNKSSSTILLKTLIKEAIILKENDGFDNLSGHIQSNPLYATFIQPFTDIVQTGAYAVKRIGNVAQNEFLSVLKQTAAAVVPFVAADTMDELKQESREQLSKSLEGLDKQYADVINRNIDAVINQTDVWGLAFLFNPGMLLGSKLLLKTPELAASFIGSMLAGTSIGNYLLGWASELEALNNDPASVFFSQRKNGGGSASSGGGSTSVDWGAGSHGGGTDGGGGYDMDIGGYLEEQQQQFQPLQQPQQFQVPPQPKQLTAQQQQAINKWAAQRKKQLQAQINQTLKSQNTIKGIATSSIGKRMQKAGIDSIITVANKNLAFNDWNQMLQRHNKNQKLKQLDHQLTEAMQKQKMDQGQIAQEKNKLVPVIKEQMKTMLIKQVQKYGMQGNSQYGQQAITKAIQQIKSIH